MFIHSQPQGLQEASFDDGNETLDLEDLQQRRGGNRGWSSYRTWRIIPWLVRAW